MAEAPGSLLTWMLGMVERQPKDLTCCQEWGFVLHLAPGDFCHLPLVSCISLAPHASRATMSVFQGSSRNWDLLPSFQNAQGKELGGAAVVRVGNTRSPACPRL